MKISTYLLIVIVMSVITFGMYALDKRQARLHRWRASEKTLLTLGLLGGWPGAILAQQKLRHKNQKTSYQISFWITVILHFALTFAIVRWGCW